ncbi:MAG: glycosyl transferase family 1 [Thiotrichales bacterium]|nr:MAG: glycosyl transferase family 1 [Thiotrichales bacterium]
MKILHLGKYYDPAVGGIETFLRNLVPEQIRLGNDVRVLVHNEKKGRKSFLEKKDEVSVYRCRCFGQLVYAPVSPEYPYFLTNVLKEFKPDVLHIHLPNISPYWLLCSRTARKIPWIVHWHSDVVPSAIDKRVSFAYTFYQILEKRLLDHASYIIPTSKRYLKASQPLLKYRDKCRIVPLGLKIKDAEQVPSKDISSIWSKNGKYFRILCIGRLTYYKGYEILIDAISTLKQVNVDVKIIGDGDKKKELEKKIVSSNVTDSVTLCGKINDKELERALVGCDCLCLPSVERTEAFGVVLLEAMAMSKPVIASDIEGSGVGWVVQHKKTGLLVEPRNAYALAETITNLSTDRQLQKELGKNGFHRVKSCFTVEKIASEIQQVYKGIPLKQQRD